MPILPAEYCTLSMISPEFLKEISAYSIFCGVGVSAACAVGGGIAKQNDSCRWGGKCAPSFCYFAAKRVDAGACGYGNCIRDTLLWRCGGFPTQISPIWQKNHQYRRGCHIKDRFNLLTFSHTCQKTLNLDTFF